MEGEAPRERAGLGRACSRRVPRVLGEWQGQRGRGGRCAGQEGKGPGGEAGYAWRLRACVPPRPKQQPAGGAPVPATRRVTQSGLHRGGPPKHSHKLPRAPLLRLHCSQLPNPLGDPVTSSHSPRDVLQAGWPHFLCSGRGLWPRAADAADFIHGA